MKIKEVTLFTNNIQQQRQFYRTKLGLETIKDTLTKVSFKTGNSILVFKYSETANPSHIAFNIPYNAIYDALRWAQNRVALIPYKNKLITNFKSWNAKSIYFKDPDANIIEFIARENINIESDIAFTPRLIISISEIAIATDNIKTIYNQINSIKSIPIFDENFNRFCALGSDEGLFLIINKNKKKWYPTMENALTSNFIIKGDYNFSFIDGKIKELS